MVLADVKQRSSTNRSEMAFMVRQGREGKVVRGQSQAGRQAGGQAGRSREGGAKWVIWGKALQ